MIYPTGTPTQPEVIAIALSKLNIRTTDIFADIGCGSGSVSISAAHLAKCVYAIDNREEAIRAATENIRECGLTNVQILKGEASQLLVNMDDIEIDCAFVGGSRNMEQVLEILVERVPRFVISAVRMETVFSALKIMEKNNVFKELLYIQLSRGNDLAGGTMLKPENPVFLITGGLC